jgi:hypothetical protein
MRISKAPQGLFQGVALISGKVCCGFYGRSVWLELMPMRGRAALEYIHGAAVGTQRLALDFNRQKHARMRIPRDHARRRAMQGQVAAADFDDALGVFV